ncbi:hypothetical protein IAU59_002686 [Kwoniella sp. CBS 9459]
MSQTPHQPYDLRQDHEPATLGYTAPPRSSGMPPTAYHGTLPYHPNVYWDAEPHDTTADSRSRRATLLSGRHSSAYPTYFVGEYSQLRGTAPAPYNDTQMSPPPVRHRGRWVQRNVGYVDPATVEPERYSGSHPPRVAHDEHRALDTAPASYDTQMLPPTGTRGFHPVDRPVGCVDPPPWTRPVTSQSPDMSAYYPLSEQQARDEHEMAMFDHLDYTCPLSDLRSELGRLMDLSDDQSREIRRLRGRNEGSNTQQVQSKSDSEEAWTRSNLLDQVTEAGDIIEHKARLIAALRAETAALPTTREAERTEEQQSQVRVARWSTQVVERPAGDQRPSEAHYEPLNVPHTSSHNTSAYPTEQASHYDTTLAHSGYLEDPSSTGGSDASGTRSQWKGKQRMP